MKFFEMMNNEEVKTIFNKPVEKTSEKIEDVLQEIEEISHGDSGLLDE